MIGIFLALTVPELEAFIANSKHLEVLQKNATIDPSLFSIDNTWDALAYLVSELSSSLSDKTALALSWLIYGNKAVDEQQDLGYGPAHYLLPEQVGLVNEALDSLTIDILRAKYDPVRMNEMNVYPGFWDDENDRFEHLETHYERLRSFYAKAFSEGSAVLMFIH